MALSVYKKGQGTAARGTAGVVGVLLAIWAAHQTWVHAVGDWTWPFRVAATGIVATLFGVVPLYLILFHRHVVDLLIETQQEMRKVAWSSRGEVVGASVVVIVTVALLSLFIFATDIVIGTVNHLLGLY